jgi:hypothetical protein
VDRTGNGCGDEAPRERENSRHRKTKNVTFPPNTVDLAIR